MSQHRRAWGWGRVVPGLRQHSQPSLPSDDHKDAKKLLQAEPGFGLHHPPTPASRVCVRRALLLKFLFSFLFLFPAPHSTQHRHVLALSYSVASFLSRVLRHA